MCTHTSMHVHNLNIKYNGCKILLVLSTYLVFWLYYYIVRWPCGVCCYRNSLHHIDTTHTLRQFIFSCCCFSAPGPVVPASRRERFAAERETPKEGMWLHELHPSHCNRSYIDDPTRPLRLNFWVSKITSSVGTVVLSRHLSSPAQVCGVPHAEVQEYG